MYISFIKEISKSANGITKNSRTVDKTLSYLEKSTFLVVPKVS